MITYFNTLLLTMTLCAIAVFFSLYNIKAGYGRFYNETWGPTISNRIGWLLMGASVFFFMIYLWLNSDRAASWPHIVILSFFELHYFQRTFIFPMLLRGRSVMPVSIIAMGVLFNIFNALMLGGWIFYISPKGYYNPSWFSTPQFIIGSLVFVVGMAVNLHSDHIIRLLRHRGETKHYLPQRGLFRYVTSANYMGECIEWIGFALLSWSWAAAVFAFWTIATLTPRAAAIYERYQAEFPEAFAQHSRKRILPFVY